MGKKLVIAVGVLFGLVVLAAVAVPMFVDVDKYRPQMVAKANEYLNGNLELGKLKLSLWGQVKIEVDGIQLSDSRKREIVSVKDVYFHVPFLSLITLAPTFELRMSKPELRVVKDASGKMNVMSLVKTEKAAPTPTTQTENVKTDSASGGAGSLPGIATRAAFGLQMNEARLLYLDEATELKSEIKDLNVKVKNLSLSKPTDVEIRANLDTKMGKTFVLKGPFSFIANFEAKPERFTLHKATAKFLNAEVTVEGQVTDFDTDPGYMIKAVSNEINLKPWIETLPSLKEYELGGTASFNVDAKGSVARPGYVAVFKMKDATAKAPHLKAPMNVNGSATVKPDVADIDATVTAPGNELKVAMNLVSFTKPNVNLSITSKGMDLDQWVEFPKAGEKTATGAPAASGGGGTAGQAGSSSQTGASGSDYDALLDPLRENKMARDAVAKLKVRMEFLKAYGVKMNGITADGSMKNLAMNLETFRMSLFSGKVDASAAMDLAPKTPIYRFKATAEKLNLQDAVASQVAMFKDTLVGIADFKMDGTGRSFNPDPTMRNLEAKGNLKVNKAKFATIDIGKMVVEGLNKSIQSLGDKVPPLKGKTLGTPGNIDSKYEFMSADFTISKGVFLSPNFHAKAEVNAGLDVKGQTTAGLIDRSLNAKWEIIDTYNLTKARDLSVESNGVKVDRILVDGNEPLKLPVEITGTLTAPKPSYTSIPEALGKVALNNVGKAAVGKVKQEAQKQVTDAIKKFGGGLFGK